MDFSRLSQADLSKAIGVPARTIRSWEDIPRNSDRTYSLQAVVQWLISRADDADSAAPLDPESQQWLQKFRRERFKLAKIERLKAQGSLVHKDTIEAAWVGRVAATMHMLTNLVNRLPPLLEGRPRSEMYDIIDDEIRAARNAYVEDGPFCHLPEQCIYRGGTGCDGKLPPPADPCVPPDGEEA